MSANLLSCLAVVLLASCPTTPSATVASCSVSATSDASRYFRISETCAHCAGITSDVEFTVSVERGGVIVESRLVDIWTSSGSHRYYPSNSFAEYHELLPEEATAPKEEDAAAVGPEAEESTQETLSDEPPPPPAKSWFGRAEPESEAEEADETLPEETLPAPPAKGWFWREPEPEPTAPEPEPEEAEEPPLSSLSPFSALRAERERELKTLASP